LLDEAYLQKHPGQNVIEVVRDPAGQLANGLGARL